ncbi:MAG: type II secretion system F family protein, partial [bacterium]|nr:type II secretion system F family protein [bacterium]
MNKLFLRLSNQDKILFAKRLAILVKAGVPILDSLRMLKKQATSSSAIKILESVSADVENGQSLFISLGRFKNVFGDFALNIIQVGELSGTLQENLHYLAEELDKKQELKRKVVGALVYPVIIMGATIGISALLTVFIFPKILPVFASFKFELPVTTRILIFISTILINYGIFILLGLVAAAVIFWALFKKINAFRFAVDSLVLRIPVFGRIAKSYHMTNFCRTLGLLLKSQLMIVQATTVTANTINNSAYKKEILIIAEN